MLQESILAVRSPRVAGGTHREEQDLNGVRAGLDPTEQVDRGET